MWQETLKPFIDRGEVVAIGVVEEQHPDRARLYRQWRQLDWPIAVDALDLFDHRAVPIPMAIDESGVVRSRRPRPDTFAAQFLRKKFAAVTTPADYRKAEPPELPVLERAAKGGGARASRDLGDALFVHGGSERLDDAIGAYSRAVELDAKDGRAHFRLGVAVRRRSESGTARAGDAQRAVAEWGLALAVDPGQYIWRRRIQQFGPRLDKPYNFYFWVEKAREEIRARGETPLELVVEPRGSEVASPRRGKTDAVSPPEDLDPKRRLPVDRDKLIHIESVVTPARVRPGHRVRVRVTLRPGAKRPYWNNEGPGLRLWAGFSESLSLDEGTFEAKSPAEPETRETRVLEFEARVADDAEDGEMRIAAYALYDVCLDVEGVCYRYRQDFEIPLRVARDAPKIQ